jgi:uncharacterized membrane protein
MDERPWPQVLAVLVAVALYLMLPRDLLIGSPVIRYAIPALELLLVVVLATPGWHRRLVESGKRRHVSIALIALIGLGNAIALGVLLHQLLYGGGIAGRTLLFASFDVWATNVIVFGLWYWELDGGGPVRRGAGEAPEKDRDFAFIQMTDPEVRAKNWEARFPDYLYVAFTNASAFSPTDTMPLTRRAKLLMILQSAVSMITLLLVAARAVNVLKG